jgi:hypothetical protein
VSGEAGRPGRRCSRQHAAAAFCPCLHKLTRTPPPAARQVCGREPARRGAVLRHRRRLGHPAGRHPGARRVSTSGPCMGLPHRHNKIACPFSRHLHASACPANTCLHKQSRQTPLPRPSPPLPPHTPAMPSRWPPRLRRAATRRPAWRRRRPPSSARAAPRLRCAARPPVAAPAAGRGHAQQSPGLHPCEPQKHATHLPARPGLRRGPQHRHQQGPQDRLHGCAAGRPPRPDPARAPPAALASSTLFSASPIPRGPPFNSPMPPHRHRPRSRDRGALLCVRALRPAGRHRGRWLLSDLPHSGALQHLAHNACGAAAAATAARRLGLQVRWAGARRVCSRLRQCGGLRLGGLNSMAGGWRWILNCTLTGRALPPPLPPACSLPGFPPFPAFGSTFPPIGVGFSPIAFPPFPSFGPIG